MCHFFVIVVFENCVSLKGRPISNKNVFFFLTPQCSISHICLSSTLMLLRIMCISCTELNRTEEYIFSLKRFCNYEQKINQNKDCHSVNVKSKNGKILNAGCYKAVTIPLTIDKK